MVRRHPARRSGLTAAVLLSAVTLASPAMGTTLRLAEYNIDCSDQGNNDNITGPNNGVPTILQAMGVHQLVGDAQPIDVLALTELLDTNNNNITSTTLPAIVTALNNIYGAGTYAYDTTPDPTSGGTEFNGPSGIVYDTKTVVDLGAKALGYGTNPRAPMRYEFQPVGAGSSADFYMYVSHMKSGETSSDKSERGFEAAEIRTDEATLPTNSSVIYTGDYNSSPPEAEFTDLTAAGPGQAFDPENFTTSKTFFSESTDDLQYRDDYELMTSNIINDTGPIQYVTGSFQVFGNNGTTAAGGKTNAAGNTSLSDLPNASAVLADLMQPYGSDHMPVEADYNVVVGPVPVTWNDASADNLWDTSSSNWNNGSGNATYMDGDAVTLNDSNGGNYSVTLNVTVNPGSVTVNNSLGNYVIGGTGSIAGSAALSKSGSGTLTLATVNTYTGGTTVNAGELVVGVNGALPNGSVTITGGLLQLGTSTGLAQVTSLSISGNGILDVNNNHVILNYGSGPDPIGSIASLIASGYNGGAWNGTGIISSAAAAAPGYGLGYADAADAGNPANLTSGTIEIKYTLLGDANLDGVVNGIDFGILAANFNKGVTGWDAGDFNYDNIVNGIDFGDLAANFNLGANGTSIGTPAYDDPAILAFARANGLLADVPEPGSLGLCAVAGAWLMRRRGRRITPHSTRG